MAGVRKITVLNPAVSRWKMKPDEPPPNSPELAGKFRFEPSSVELAKRLDTLENKTVYLVDIGFGGGYAFMQEIQRWFARNIPSVTSVVKR